MLQNNGISEKKNEHVFQIYYQKSARNFMPFIKINLNPLELCRVDSVLVNYHIFQCMHKLQCVAFINHRLSPQCLRFQTGKKKLRVTQAFTVAIFRLINANYIFLEMTLWYRKIDVLKNFNYTSILMCKSLWIIKNNFNSLCNLELT